MGMKERREARWQNLFGQFVSVKGLINYFANEEGLDISDVAAELEGVIKNSDDSELPEFGSIDPAGVVFVPWSGEVDCRSHLMDWLSDTIMGYGHGDASDFHGWMRDDLFPFLRSHGFGVNSDFPPWAPSSEIASEPSCSVDLPAIVGLAPGQGGYSTPLLKLQAAAVAEFFEPRRNVDARKDEVVGWIKTKATEAGLLDSNNLAEAIFSIIKPTDHNPKRRRGLNP